jgi:serine/threonine protein phosphatase PrpC
VRLGHRSEIGHVRARNEDAWLLRSGPDGSCIAVVADGMGGHPAGDVASAVAVRVLGDRLADAAALGQTPGPTLVEALVAAHDAVLRDATADTRHRGMGTTAVIAYVERARAWVAHVGDSRAYLIRGGAALPLTADHGEGGYLTQALGLSGVRPDLAVVDLAAEDRILLCSDGLSGMLDVTTIGILAADPTPQDACDQLVDAALAAGGYDNVTVVLVDPS